MEGKIINNILAIDPGSSKSAYVYFQDSVLFSGIINNSEIFDLIKNYYFKLILLEDIISYGRPIGESVLDTCKFIGGIQYLCAFLHKDLKLYSRKEIKKILFGKIIGNDREIRALMLSLYPKIKLKNDEWQALALLFAYQQDQYSRFPNDNGRLDLNPDMHNSKASAKSS